MSEEIQNFGKTDLSAENDQQNDLTTKVMTETYADSTKSRTSFDKLLTPLLVATILPDQYQSTQQPTNNTNADSQPIVQPMVLKLADGLEVTISTLADKTTVYNYRDRAHKDPSHPERDYTDRGKIYKKADGAEVTVRTIIKDGQEVIVQQHKDTAGHNSFRYIYHNGTSIERIEDQNGRVDSVFVNKKEHNQDKRILTKSDWFDKTGKKLATANYENSVIKEQFPNGSSRDIFADGSKIETVLQSGKTIERFFDKNKKEIKEYDSNLISSTAGSKYKEKADAEEAVKVKARVETEAKSKAELAAKEAEAKLQAELEEKAQAARAAELRAELAKVGTVFTDIAKELVAETTTVFLDASKFVTAKIEEAKVAKAAEELVEKSIQETTIKSRKNEAVVQSRIDFLKLGIRDGNLKLNNIDLTDDDCRAIYRLVKADKIKSLEIRPSVGLSKLSETGITIFGSLKNLRSLNVQQDSNLNKDFLQSIGGLENLESLTIWGTQIPPDGLALLKNPRLRELSLSNSFLFTDNNSQPINLPALEQLDLASTNVSDDNLKTFANLPNLKSLCLERTKISGEGLIHFQKSPIEKLDLSSSEVSDSGLTSLSKLTNLTSIDLSHTQVTNEALPQLTNLKHIEELNLNGTKVSDKGMPIIGALPALKSLDLSKTVLTDWGLQDLESLEHLEKLSLAQTKITGKRLRHLSKELQELHLDGTDLSNEHAFDLKDLPKIRELSLADTKITDLSISLLLRLKDLVRVDLLKQPLRSESSGIIISPENRASLVAHINQNIKRQKEMQAQINPQPIAERRTGSGN